MVGLFGASASRPTPLCMSTWKLNHYPPSGTQLLLEVLRDRTMPYVPVECAEFAVVAIGQTIGVSRRLCDDTLPPLPDGEGNSPSKSEKQVS
jgi:hypothetical protein